MNTRDLLKEFAGNAVSCREIGSDRRGARIWLKAAALLQRALREEADELLTTADAVRESGYSAAALKRQVPNRSTKAGEWLFRRGDLPRKPCHDSGEKNSQNIPENIPDGASVVASIAPVALPSRRQIARDVVSGRG